MPYIRIIINSPKPKEKFPDPHTVGEHIRKRRSELGLYQRQVACEIGVDVFTIHNWEKERSQPLAAHYPAIIRFLGYALGAPKEPTVPELLKSKRRMLGLTQREVAMKLGVDPATVTGWEKGDTVLRKENRRALAAFLDYPEEEFVTVMGERWVASHRRSEPEQRNKR